MSRSKGDKAEKKAEEYLNQHGFVVVEKNFYIRGGEVDIIATKDEVYHFVEVKSGEGFEPVFNITPQKLQRVIKTALVYMKKKAIDAPFCIDAVIIKSGEIEFIENVTL